jgi:hypothetical protein
MLGLRASERSKTRAGPQPTVGACGRVGRLLWWLAATLARWLTAQLTDSRQLNVWCVGVLNEMVLLVWGVGFVVGAGRRGAREEGGGGGRGRKGEGREGKGRGIEWWIPEV